MSLAATDLLVLPNHRKAVSQYSTAPDGGERLTIYYGDKEIEFDDPDMFGFGEGLVGQESFIARDAIDWSPSAGWATISRLLEELLDAGLIHRATANDTGRAPAPTRLMPSPLPRASSGPHQTWADTEQVMQSLCGQRLPAGYLELVVPVFRVAHPVLDRDGRQVGEANVFPQPLRIETPTEWRACPHAGTRFQAPQPMNITAMRTMRTHWGQMMQVLAILRAAYLERFPLGAKGWTVADVERLATLVLAVPTWMLMRRDNPVRSGDLHPVLSSLFRVTDGLRLTAHQMLFVPGAEPSLAPDAPVSSAEIHAYAERNYNFHTAHGVCAGPKAMVEEFLGVILDGAAPRDPRLEDLDEQVAAALDDLDAAFDYGLLGLQVHFAAFAHWPILTRAMARIGEAAEGRTGAFWTRMTALAHRVATATYHSDEDRRSARERTYATLAADCNAGLAPDLRTTIPATWISATLRRQFEALATDLRRDLRARLPGEASERIEMLHSALMDFVIGTHAHLNTALQIQTKLNRRLGRSEPDTPFRAQDMQIHLLIQGRADDDVMPHLLDELKTLLGLSLSITADGASLDPINPLGGAMSA